MNYGKWKLLVQQAFGMLQFPVIIFTNILLVFDIFGKEVAIAVLLVLGLVFLVVVGFVDRVTLAQELDYSWGKCSEWQEFKKEWSEVYKGSNLRKV